MPTRTSGAASADLLDEVASLHAARTNGNRPRKRNKGMAGGHGCVREATAADDCVRAFDSDARPVPIFEVQ